jgi:hypothetical protein
MSLVMKIKGLQKKFKHQKERSNEEKKEKGRGL